MTTGWHFTKSRKYSESNRTAHTENCKGELNPLKLKWNVKLVLCRLHNRYYMKVKKLAISYGSARMLLIKHFLWRKSYHKFKHQTFRFRNQWQLKNVAPILPLIKQHSLILYSRFKSNIEDLMIQRGKCYLEMELA